MRSSGAFHPLRSSRPVLPLPDGDALFQFVDDESGGFERIAAMGGGNRDRNRRVADGDVPDPMLHDNGEDRPPSHSLGTDLRQLGLDVLGVRLVFQMGDAGLSV